MRTAAARLPHHWAVWTLRALLEARAEAEAEAGEGEGEGGCESEGEGEGEGAGESEGGDDDGGDRGEGEEGPGAHPRPRPRSRPRSSLLPVSARSAHARSALAFRKALVRLAASPAALAGDALPLMMALGADCMQVGGALLARG